MSSFAIAASWQRALIGGMRVIAGTLILSALLGLVGCGSDDNPLLTAPTPTPAIPTPTPATPTPSPTPTPVTLSGHIFGGALNPISGATMKLFAMGGSYGSGATSIAST